MASQDWDQQNQVQLLDEEPLEKWDAVPIE